MNGLYVPQSIPPSSLAQRAEWLLAKVDEFPDLDRRKASRICEIARAVLKEGPDVISSERPDFTIVLQAEKDLREIEFIWAILNPSPQQPELWRKLKTVFGDNPLPSDNLSQSKARDAQFELLVLAMLERSGLSPVINNSGADFSCVIGSNKVCVEAKRLTSIDRLEDRIRGAAHQIETLNMPGFICLDFSIAVNPGDQVYILKGPINKFGQAQSKRFYAFWHDHHARVERAIGDRRVIGLTLFDHLIMQTGISKDKSTGKWELASMRDNIFLSSTVLGDRKIAELFFDLTENLGLPVETV